MKIICIIPAYNEAKTIVEVINDIKPFVNKVVMVDDNSTDDTFNLAKNQGITILHHIINRVQGAALQTGNEYALDHGAGIIVHFDADGQFVAEEIPNFIRVIEAGESDLVLGSRFLGKKSQIPWTKKFIILPLAKIVNRIFTGVNLTDPQNGFRAMSAFAAKTIKIEQNGMAHCSEILAKAFANNLRVKEIPATVIYHDFGQRFSGGLKILMELILARLIN